MDLSKKISIFLKKAKKPLIVVLGPTASGKTALSLKIAKMIDGEIISTDSRQIYKEMEIGTEALPVKKREGIKHHLISFRKPDDTLTLADYKKMAEKIIGNIYNRKKIPILAGGTGLYISAIVEGYQIPEMEPDKNLREKLKNIALKNGNQYLHDILKKLDKNAAKSIHPNNLPYLIRAIEINMKTGKNKSDTKSKKSPYDLFFIGVEWPREDLYKRINTRVEDQIKRGLLDEVKKLLDKGYDSTLPAISSLGMKEFIPYYQGTASLEEVLEILKRNTRRYAKRQITWFKRYKNILWLSPKDLSYFLEK